jgi:photosystem II stability/assembly factor-like uncharacterized protein
LESNLKLNPEKEAIGLAVTLIAIFGVAVANGADTDMHIGWVVGERGTILATSDGGKHWVDQYDGDKFLAGVCFVDACTGWVVGEKGTIFTTPDGGEDFWLVQDSSTDLDLASVYFADARTGWVVGRLGTILATSDGGKHWLVQDTSTDLDLTSVYFADAHTGWVVGWGGTILATSDGGKHWLVEDSGIPENLYGVHFIDARTGWVVGEKATILATHDGGKHWLAQDASAISPPESDFVPGKEISLNGVYFVDARTGWVIGEGGTILATHDGGEHWLAENSGTDSELRGVYFIEVRQPIRKAIPVAPQEKKPAEILRAIPVKPADQENED